MKKLAIIFALCLFVLTMPYAQKKAKTEMPQEKGHRVNVQERIKEHLGLTDAQFKKLEELRFEVERKNKSVRIQIKKHLLSIEEFLLEDKINYDKIKDILKDINELELQLKFEKFDNLQKVEKILNKDQFGKFKAFYLDKKDHSHRHDRMEKACEKVRKAKEKIKQNKDCH